MELNHAQQQLAKDFFVSVLITGNGRYGYFAVRGDKVNDFHKLVATPGTFNLPDYATLLEEGAGMPSAEVKKRMEEEYGLSHDFIGDLKKQASA